MPNGSDSDPLLRLRWFAKVLPFGGGRGRRSGRPNFGQTDIATTQYAHKLGLAFQLTNILRDVGEDALRGRIYLPIDELKQFDVKAQDLMQRQYSDRFTALMKFQAARAHRLYEEAFAMLPSADKQTQNQAS